MLECVLPLFVLSPSSSKRCWSYILLSGFMGHEAATSETDEKPVVSSVTDPEDVDMDPRDKDNEKDIVVGAVKQELDTDLLEHPRKRKIRTATNSGSVPTTVASTLSSSVVTAGPSVVTSVAPTPAPYPVVYPSPNTLFRIDAIPHNNPLDIFFKIRRLLEIQRRQLAPVPTKPPQGYRDYLIHRGTYVLDGNPQAQLAASTQLCPPPGVMGIPALRDLFVTQENERAKLRLKYVLGCPFPVLELLKRPQVIETTAFPSLGYALTTARTQVKIQFVQYLNFN